MHSRVIQQVSVLEILKVGRRCFYVVNKNLIFVIWLFVNIMNVTLSQGEANLVPAAAVIRGPRVFDHVTRCMRPHRRLKVFLIKYWDLILRVFSILFNFEYNRGSRYF